MPEAQAYLAKRERSQLLEEQLGYPNKAHSVNNVAPQTGDQPQYIELRELTRQVNTTNADSSVQNIGTAAMTEYTDFDGLGSLTDYTALPG